MEVEKATATEMETAMEAEAEVEAGDRGGAETSSLGVVSSLLFFYLFARFFFSSSFFFYLSLSLSNYQCFSLYAPRMTPLTNSGH
jgi:hypothetical protein